MTYVLRFLPEVERDVLNGRDWYEGKSPGTGRGISACLLRLFPGIDPQPNGLTRECTGISAGVCCAAFPTRSISELKQTAWWSSVCFIVPETRAGFAEICETAGS